MRGIDNAAHLGGLVGGCACGVLLGQPVTLAAAHYRWLRNLLVVVLGGAITAGGLASIPPPANVEAALADFAAVEQAAVDRYNALMQQEQNGDLTPEQFAETIEREILPPWAAARQRFEQLQNIPPRLRSFVAAYVKYVRLREEYWQYQVQFKRTPDPNADRELADAEQRRSGRLVRNRTDRQRAAPRQK